MISKIFDYIQNIGFFTFALFLFYLINPFNYGFVFGYFLIISIVLKAKFVKENLDFNFVIILIYSLTYGLFYALDPKAGVQFIFVYSFTPPFFYLWGKYLTLKAKSSNRLFYVILSIGTIFSLAGLVSVVLNIMEGGLAQSSRSIPMFWSDMPINATGMAALFLFNMCIPSILLSNYKRINISIKILLSIVFTLSFLCVLRLGSRTQIVVMLFTFLVTLFFVIPKQTPKQNAGLFILLLIGVYFVFRNVSFDLDEDWLTSFAGRMEKGGTGEIASGGGRTERWVKSFENLFKKPLGWDLDEFGYSHNLWLDVLRAGGVLSFFLLIFLSVKSFIEAKRAFLADPGNIGFNILILTYFISFMLLFFVEPIIDGSFSIFVLFCLFLGILNQYSSLIIKLKTQKEF